MTFTSLKFTLDLNQDGAISAWEVWEALVWLYRLPGNLILETLGQLPWLPGVLGLKASAATGYGSLDGAISVAVSLVFWVIVFMAVCKFTSRRRPAPDDTGMRRLCWQDRRRLQGPTRKHSSPPM